RRRRDGCDPQDSSIQKPRPNAHAENRHPFRPAAAIAMPAIYLDNNAATALDPAVLSEMLPYLSGSPGNASSKHAFGRKARQAVERSKERIAAALDCEPSEVVFTSGATEANNLALNAFSPPGRALVSAVEHPSLLEPALELKKRG